MKKLLFLDLETTGLDQDNDLILEVAAVVVDLEFPELRVIESRSWVVYLEPEALGKMNAWCLRQHGASGLSSACELSILSLEQVDMDLHRFILKFWPLAPQRGMEEKAVIAGSSIHFDRNFVRRLMPETESLLHYRMLDVSALGIVFLELGHNAELPTPHRALPDCMDSVRELQEYLGAMHHWKVQGAPKPVPQMPTLAKVPEDSSGNTH